MEEKILEKIGLTRNESKTYLTLLQLGTAKTGEILKESNLNSGKIYEILESLKTKGLVSESVINKVRHFTAAPPSRILEYLERRKEEIETDEKTIMSALPDLEKLRQVPSGEVKAITYTGLDGMKTAIAEATSVIKPGNEILVMGITGKKDEKFNRMWKKWQSARIAKKIPQRMLFSERSDYYDFFKNLNHTKARVLEGLTPVTIDIFGDEIVMILNYPEPTSCILIYSKNTTTSFRQFFEQLWRIAKP